MCSAQEAVLVSTGMAQPKVGRWHGEEGWGGMGKRDGEAWGRGGMGEEEAWGKRRHGEEEAWGRGMGGMGKRDGEWEDTNQQEGVAPSSPYPLCSAQ